MELKPGYTIQDPGEVKILPGLGKAPGRFDNPFLQFAVAGKDVSVIGILYATYEGAFIHDNKGNNLWLGTLSPDADITNIIEFLVHHPDSNFGVMIKLYEEIAHKTLCFCSSDFEGDTLRPKLEITYSEGPFPSAMFEDTDTEHASRFSIKR